MPKNLFTSLVFISIFTQNLNAMETSISGSSKVVLTSPELNNENQCCHRYYILEAPQRINLKTFDETEIFQFELSYQLIPRKNLVPINDNSPIFRKTIINPTPVNDSPYTINQNLDRFYGTYSPENWFITIGRQQLTFGASQFIKPMDIFAPQSLYTLDTEERPGVDMSRIKYFTKNGEIDIGYILTSDSSNNKNAYYAKWTDILGDFEYGLMTASFLKNNLFGFYYQPEFFAMGWSIEATYVESKNSFKKKNYHKLSLGGLKLIESGWSISWEYTFQSLGKQQPKHYSELYFDEHYLNSASSLLGEQYIHLALGVPISPILLISTSASHNFFDKSQLLRNYLEWNFAENDYLVVTSIIGTGTRSTEFSKNQNLVNLAYRHYF